MNSLCEIQSFPAIGTMPDQMIQNLDAINDRMKELPQIEISTQHVIHGGMYCRTIQLYAGTALMGALIKIPTVLIVSGRIRTATADGEIELSGYCVIPGMAGRKQLIVAVEDSFLTMCFPTKAKTVEEAEKEFTDDYESLMSHFCNNDVLITGE